MALIKQYDISGVCTVRKVADSPHVKKLAKEARLVAAKAKKRKDASFISKSRIVGSSFCIRSNYVVRRNIWFSDKEKTKPTRRETDKNLLDNSHTGELSSQSQKKLTAAINWMAACALKKWVPESVDHKAFEFKLNFITLTLAATGTHITHSNIHKLLLSKFLDYARKYWGLNNYVWKIELQKNGNPHIHLTTDTYIHHTKIRAYWNHLQSEEGITQLYTAKYLGCSFDFYLKHNPTTDFADVSKRWEQWKASTKQGFTSPNTIDVHAVKNIKNIASYLCKYMCKNLNETIMVQGLSALAAPSSTARMWGCSYALSRAYSTSLDIYDADVEEGDGCFYNGDFQVAYVLGNPDRCGIRHPIADIIFVKPNDWHNKVKGKVYRVYHEVRLRIQNAYRNQEVVNSMVKKNVVSLN